MTVRLLWHSFYFDGPVAGLCVVEGKKMVFTRTMGQGKDSKYSLYVVTDEELNGLEKTHSDNQLIIGGINDYGEAFRNRFARGMPEHNASLTTYKYPETMELHSTITQKDIINPFQHL